MLIVAFAFNSNAQKVVVKNGDVTDLPASGTFNVEYDYSKLKVGKFKTEALYVNDQVSKKNNKENGLGDTWKESWESARDRKYHPKFELLFNKELAERGISLKQGVSSDITLIVHVIFIEPGYNIGISKKPSYVSYEFEFVKTADRSKKIAVLALSNVIGEQAMGIDFDTETRVGESFAKGGKILGGFIHKKFKKAKK